MSDLVIRDGVLLTKILDQYLLVSTKACREKCPYVKRINDSAAFYWQMIESGKTIDEMVDSAMNAFGLNDRDEVLQDVMDYITLLKAGGYLLSDDELKEI